MATNTKPRPSLPTFERIDYRSGGHGYRLDGEKVPGVTTILGGGIPKPALLWWGAEMTAIAALDDPSWLLLDRAEAIDYLRHEHVRVKDAAGQRGTHMHLWAQHFAETGEMPADVTVDALLFAQNLARFFQEWEPQVRIAEVPVCNRTHGYAGQLDLVCEFPKFPHLGTALVDYKSRQSDPRRVPKKVEKPPTPHAEVCLQLEAYDRAEFYLSESGQLLPMPKIDRHLVVLVTETAYTVHEVESGDQVWAEFLAAKTIYEFGLRGERKDSPVGPPMELPEPTLLDALEASLDPFANLP